MSWEVVCRGSGEVGSEQSPIDSDVARTKPAATQHEVSAPPLGLPDCCARLARENMSHSCGSHMVEHLIALGPWAAQHSTD